MLQGQNLPMQTFSACRVNGIRACKDIQGGYEGDAASALSNTLCEEDIARFVQPLTDAEQ